MIICDFSVKRGDFTLNFKEELPGQGVTGISGESGSGKTTLLRLMAGLDKTDSATFIVNGIVFQNAQTFIPTAQRSIGYVGQSVSLFPFLTAYQNIQFADKRASNNARILRKIDEMITVFNVEYCLNKPAHQLSSGEAQRIKLIQSIASRPNLFLFDEALSAIDEQRKGKILAYLKKYLSEFSIPAIFVSHDLTELEVIADKQLRIQDPPLPDSTQPFSIGSSD